MQLYLFTHWFHFIEIGKKIRACGHDFEDVDQYLWVCNYRRGPNWVRGTVIERTGSVLFRVKVNDQTWRRHVEQLRDSYLCANNYSKNKIERSNVRGRVNQCYLGR